ncbi:hypothetical protein PPL19_02625 [Pseudomonas psychrotolerans L19]|nr:hypothetical protein PPL19_02625 [Pseudomonas psychrotolerans L19]
MHPGRQQETTTILHAGRHPQDAAQLQGEPTQAQAQQGAAQCSEQHGRAAAPEIAVTGRPPAGQPEQRQAQRQSGHRAGLQADPGRLPMRRQRRVEQAELGKFQAGEVIRSQAIADLIMQRPIEGGQGDQRQ